MKLRTLVLGSVASLSLLGALSIPSLAQDANNPPQYSSPQERQQTQQLNGQAADGTTATPEQLNGQAPMNSQAPTGSAAQAQYDAQQSQYQQQQQQYNDQQQRYHAEHRAYENEARKYDVREYAWSDYPHRVYAYRYGDDRGLSRLYLIADPQKQLWQAPVEGPNGEWVGKVRNIETGVDSRPNRIEISLNRRVSVWVPAGDFRFDASDRILFTDLTRDQLWDMPGATVESAGAYYAP
jgi:hypothetical protein